MKRLALCAFFALVNSFLFGQSKIEEEKIAARTKEIFTKDYNKVEQIYESNAKPYFRRFAEMQFRQPKDTTLVEATYRLYKQMAELLAGESYKVILADMKLYKDHYDKKRIGKRFDILYRRTFTGFDYEFYETCEKAVAELK